MIILFIVFFLRGCASIDETAMPTENESIATPEPIDTQIRDQAIKKVEEDLKVKKETTDKHTTNT